MKIRKFVVVGIICLFIIPLIFIGFNVRGVNVATRYNSDTLYNSNYSWSLLIDVPLLIDVGDDIQLFYLENTNNTTYNFVVERDDDYHDEISGLDFPRYLYKIIKSDTSDSLIYQYKTNPLWYTAIIFNVSFIENGVDSSVDMKYTIGYLTSKATSDLSFNFTSEVTHTNTQQDFGGLVTGIQLYFKSQFVNYVKFTDFTGATDINLPYQYREVLDFWENSPMFERLSYTGSIYGEDKGYNRGLISAMDGGGGVDKFWNLFLKIFSGIGSILSIQVLPGFPLGILIAIPLALSIVGLILWIWRR